MKILVLHGINLNMFGKREPGVYGTATLAEIDSELLALAKELGTGLECFQTNSEAEICERIHRAVAESDLAALLINAGAWTHYSYGLRDALGDAQDPHRRSTHVEHPCTRSVPRPFGDRTDRQGARSAALSRQLPAGPCVARSQHVRRAAKALKKPVIFSTHAYRAVDCTNWYVNTGLPLL
jgi:3-dehydroquinate dehydratase-2